jgi:hypothetical protein
MEGKSPWYPLEMRRGGPQSHQSERGGDEKNDEFLDDYECWIRQEGIEKELWLCFKVYLDFCEGRSRALRWIVSPVHWVG